MFWKQYSKEFPNTILHIYSSFKLYGAEEIDKKYGNWEKIKKIKNLKFHGIIPNKALLQEIKKAKLMIYPCNYAETYGNILNEAKAMKTPVISTPIGNIPALLKEKEVLVEGEPYSKKFFKDFAKTIKKLLENPKMYERIQLSMIARTDQEYYNDLNKFIGDVEKHV